MIGEGAHGRVYAATQPGTERRVAIKVIRPELADSSEFVRRFEAEAQLVARLEHPHIAPLYDFWREPGGAYLVFRLLTGGTAREAVIAGGAWSLARVSRLVEEVGGALVAAHAAGVTHNDVRAANVLLDDADGAYLSDFGIAVDAGDGAGERGDLASFAWVLWELLTGSPSPPGRSRASLTGPTEKRCRPPARRAAHRGARGVGCRARQGDSGGGWLRLGGGADPGLAGGRGSPGGVLSPVGSSERRAADEARRRDARRLVQETAAAANPYVGLRAFGEADAARFFGRGALVDALADIVDRRSLVTIVGASGSGKSSLVAAGLGPRLRAAGRTVVTMVPGGDPVESLRTALGEVSTEAPPDDLAAALAAIAGRDPLVVVVDQLEECWTRCRPDRRDEFLDLVAAGGDARRRPGRDDDPGRSVRPAAATPDDRLARRRRRVRRDPAVTGRARRRCRPAGRPGRGVVRRWHRRTTS